MLVLVIISTLARSTAITVVSVPTVVATPRTARANLAISRTRLHSVPHSPPRREPSPRSIRSPSAEAQDHHRSNVEPGVLDHDRERHHVDPTRADAPFTGGLADKTPTTPNEVRYLVPPQRETSPSYWRPQVASSLRNAIRTNAYDAEGRLREEYRTLPSHPNYSAYTRCFCVQHHFSTGCPNFVFLSDRIWMHAQQGRCFRCRGDHADENCSYNLKCKLCRGDHHKAFCFYNQHTRADFRLNGWEKRMRRAKRIVVAIRQ